MSRSLSSVEARLPPGFRFHPRDDELICDYLMNWVIGLCPNKSPSMIQVDLNKCEPWDIPESACVGGNVWYFYSQRDKKYATGSRTNRATLSGYWKATGKDRPVFQKGSTLVGMRKTLVFHQGRAPKGRKTDWVMREYRLEGTIRPDPNTLNSVQEDWVLCRVQNKKRSSEVIKQETTMTGNSTLLIFPYNNDHQICSSSTNYDYDHHDHDQSLLMEPSSTYNVNVDTRLLFDSSEQVPCFSNLFTHNQTCPTTSFDPPPQLLLPGHY